MLEKPEPGDMSELEALHTEAYSPCCCFPTLSEQACRTWRTPPIDAIDETV